MASDPLATAVALSLGQVWEAPIDPCSIQHLQDMLIIDPELRITRQIEMGPAVTEWFTNGFDCGIMHVAYKYLSVAEQEQNGKDPTDSWNNWTLKLEWPTYTIIGTPVPEVLPSQIAMLELQTNVWCHLWCVDLCQTGSKNFIFNSWWWIKIKTKRLAWLG